MIVILRCYLIGGADVNYPGALHDFQRADWAGGFGIGIVGLVYLDDGTGRADFCVVEGVVATVIIDSRRVEAIDDARWKNIVHIVCIIIIDGISRVDQIVVTVVLVVVINDVVVIVDDVVVIVDDVVVIVDDVVTSGTVTCRASGDPKPNWGTSY